ncbi:MAG: hypothetical protein OEO19_16310 [Gammaproteobacteria bacterium]|nr:hypothetical protein [Gammaproteobacteria bacterium]MDH3448202.1 hypothetical protein [Gammaproteobacteria bacterium]
MIFRGRRRGYRHSYWSLLVVGLLSACGGGAGIVAIIEIVTPIAGNWAVRNTIENLNLNQAQPDAVFFTSNLNLTAELTTQGDCSTVPENNLPLVGTLINGDLVLRRANPANSPTCLQGTFIDLITLEAGPPGLPTKLYENDRVDVQMGLGLWVSDGSGQLKLKFESPDSINNDDFDIVDGCDVSSSTAVRFDSDDMNGFNTTTRAKPTIPEIRSSNGGSILLSNVVFEDGATLTGLNSSGQTVTLRRQPDSSTTCP